MKEFRSKNTGFLSNCEFTVHIIHDHCRIKNSIHAVENERQADMARCSVVDMVMKVSKYMRCSSKVPIACNIMSIRDEHR